MTYMDSSFMAPMIPIAEPGLTMEDMCDRICEAIQGLSFAAPMVSVTPSINVPAPLVEVDLADMAADMADIKELLGALVKVLSSPLQRTVGRDPENLITSITERRV